MGRGIDWNRAGAAGFFGGAFLSAGILEVWGSVAGIMGGLLSRILGERWRGKRRYGRSWRRKGRNGRSNRRKGRMRGC